MLIDSHCHLDEYDNIEKVIKNAKNSTVEYLIVSGSTAEDNKLNISLLDKYDNLFLCCGYHPEMADKITNQDLEYLEKCLENEKVIAIGEIGLDYHYGKENIDKQKDLFRKQLDLAVKYKKPVVIHTRDAVLDTYNILKEYDVKGVIHCFSGSLETANEYIKLGFYLGIGGVVTFKNSNLKDVIKEIGLANIVLETDSPYLSPVRGERNEPANIKLIAKFLSRLLDISEKEVASITTNNVKNIFDLNI